MKVYVVTQYNDSIGYIFENIFNSLAAAKKAYGHPLYNVDEYEITDKGVTYLDSYTSFYDSEEKPNE